MNGITSFPVNSVFTFVLGSKLKVSNAVRKTFSNNEIWVDSHTNWFKAEASNCCSEIAIFGLCIDTRTGCQVSFSADEVPDSLNALLAMEWNWGGRYLILYKEKGKCFAIQDATGSIPLFYTIVDGNVVCSSNQYLLARIFGFLPDADLLTIRKSSSSTDQAMPDDVTIYREIRRLLPNHVISLETGRVGRVVNFDSGLGHLTVEQAVEETLPRIGHLADAYAKKYDIVLPVTGGKDSRLNLGVFKHVGIIIPCFTMKHPKHSGKEDDLVLPPQLANVVGCEYKQIQDVDIPQAMVDEANTWMVENQYDKSAIRMANKIISIFGHCAIINGDSAGQIGKSSINNNVPSWLFSPRYLQTKIHNYSNATRPYLKKWIHDYKDSKEKLPISDCFSVESRVGRWANEQMIYSMVGLVSLNIYNSRSILYNWAKVNRADRSKGRIHTCMLDATCPELLTIPFEHQKKYMKLAKGNWLVFYIASFIKFYTSGIQFRMALKKNIQCD